VKIDTRSIDFVKIVLIAIVLFLVASQIQCETANTPETVNTIRVETRLDTVYLSKTRYVPLKTTTVETIYQQIPTEIDTQEILKKYFAKVVYRDTISIDTFGTLIIQDTISKNLILSRELFSNIVLPTTTITTQTVEVKRVLYAGTSLSGNRGMINQISAELMLRGIGIGLNSELQPLITGNIYWKIAIRKPN
jgi:hypothetical protein